MDGNVPTDTNKQTVKEHRLVDEAHCTNEDDIYKTPTRHLSGQHVQPISSRTIDGHSNSNKGTPNKNKLKTRHADTPTGQALSGVYALLLMLIGMALHITESIHISDIQGIESFVGGFLVYLFGGSTVFLVYLQLFNLKKHPGKGDTHKLSKDVRGVPDVQSGVRISQKPSLPAKDKPLKSQPSSPASNNFTPSPCKKDNRFVETDDVKSLAYDNKGGDMADEEESVTVVGNTQENPAEFERSISQETYYEEEADVMETMEEFVRSRLQTASLAHEGTSFYLRSGALLFGLGNLLYAFLEVEYYLGNHIAKPCKNQAVWPIFFHIVFLLVQTFFLFKVSHVRVTRHRSLVQFGFMHVCATNFCIWTRILVWEIMEGATHHHHSPVAANTTKAGRLHTLNHTEGTNCVDRGSLLKQASPYLYPLILEYSLIAVANMYGIATGIGINYPHALIHATKKYLTTKYQEDTLNVLQNEHHTTRRKICDKAHRGMFAGMLFFASIMVSIALFFFSSKRGDDTHAAFIYSGSHLIAGVLMLIALTVAFVKTRKLSRDSFTSNSIDHSLLLLSMSGAFVYDMFTTICLILVLLHDASTLVPLYSLQLVSTIVTSVQSVVQAVFIIDGMQRYSQTKEAIDKKEGRGVLTFLIIANMAFWLFHTLQVKELKMTPHNDFFGEMAWNLILHLCLPLILFFRFHSSVCLADIWSSGYSKKYAGVKLTFLSDYPKLD